MNFRPAIEEDKPPLIELINDAYKVTAFFKYEKRINETEIEEYYKNGSFLILETSLQIVGCVHYCFDADSLHFNLLSVHPGMQGKDIVSSW